MHVLLTVCSLPGQLQDVCMGHDCSQADLYPVYGLLRKDRIWNLRLYVFTDAVQQCATEISL